jgi:bifunctional UDP-N-acetylglucosamine pyrophosphorylase/glucosamine-1-phosphate N-acetyltransferase
MKAEIFMNGNTIDEMRKQHQLDRDLTLEKVFNLMLKGVSVSNPELLFIKGEVSCGNNVKLGTNIVIEGRVVLGNDVSVGSNTVLRSCTIGDGTVIKSFCLLDGSVVGDNCFVGPHAHIRPFVSVGNNVSIGNFVEIKNSNIGAGCRINHLSFIGDADLSDHVTIGAGTITCNHDGVGLNRTTIEQGAYIGSGSNLIAPLRINANATVASGSTITEEVSANTLAIARTRQIAVENWKGPKSTR